MVSEEFTPYILKQLEDCDVIEGEAALFSCHACGSPSPEVSWYRGDERIIESRQFTMLVEPDPSSSNSARYVLVITRSSPAFEGFYVCEAVNAIGSVKSSASLHVQSLRIAEGKRQTDREILPDKQPVEVKKETVEKYYTLMQKLGHGKFGVVHKCVDKDTNKEYAAKISKCRSASQRQMNQNEIDILNSLNHPLIIKLIDAFEHSRQFIVILELAPGGELFERLMEDELISEMDVTFYMRQVLHATDYMHRKGILHLDLKPENIMLVSKDSTQIKIIDFSVSCRTHEGENTKVLGGTRQFNAPEVISYDPVSPATDMWSVGVITYVLLCGFPPFSGDVDSEVSSNIVKCAWDFNDEAFDDVSDTAKDFISMLLIKEPEERATSMECLEHSWLKSKVCSRKSIKTVTFASYIAKRNWKKTIAAIRATTAFARLGSQKSTDSIDEVPERSSSTDSGDGIEDDTQYIDVLTVTHDSNVCVKEALLLTIP